ncbi:YbaK/EbsC family protein [Pseudactinotalea sp. HY158]|uniref:YbaK/EbsC family protein n=1 Tax=Pseudactinotalea sp. HY158 TaxID=2654547 RepID=UPI00129C709F|nr:YbaK/EbsC family protein [Pseudactinotalea sp. HY158]QGH70566.1 hypothetical protein GCE65_14490 [Pseudactinotalea sp. HY158]
MNAVHTLDIPEPTAADGGLRYGSLTWHPAREHTDLLAPPVAAALAGFAGADRIHVAPIDPELADTAEMTKAYELPEAASVNCVIVAGRRAGEERVAACLVRATTRADVNGAVRRLLDVRKASFWPTGRATESTGMEYGGITPIGLPGQWRLLVDEAVLAGPAIIGSGLRRSKVLLPGADLAKLPGAEVISGLALPPG